MNGVKDLICPIKRIAGSDSDYFFFAYYDIPAISGSNAAGEKYHLCHRVSFMNRMPTPNDLCDIGYIDLSTGNYTSVAQTNASNFQQGAMLQWSMCKPDSEIMYNFFDGQDYRCCVQDIFTGEKRVLSRPIASVSPNGRYGISINFNRIYDFRPGYGYCNYKDKFYDEDAPADDGIFLVDMQSGESRLIADYTKLASTFKDSEGRKLVVNHITFNTESNRFVFLLRPFPNNDKKWVTALGTGDLEGNIYNLCDYSVESHYHWRDGETLLIYSNPYPGTGTENTGLYEYKDLTHEIFRYDTPFFKDDIHCSYSPDRRYILGDGYPDAEGYRAILFYDRQTKKETILGKFYGPNLNPIDIRSDLHARWSKSGKWISLDSIHEGFRGMYTMDLSSVL